MKNTVICAIIQMTQSKWIQPALVASVLVVALLGVTGCDPGHGGNHGK